MISGRMKRKNEKEGRKKGPNVTGGGGGGRWRQSAEAQTVHVQVGREVRKRSRHEDRDDLIAKRPRRPKNYKVFAPLGHGKTRKIHPK